MKMILSVLALVAASCPVFAGKADVIDVRITKSGTDYSFEVTVKSDDTGWDKYADKWEVVTVDGTVLGTRVLAHPHQDEQPFTRSLDGVVVPTGTTEVVVCAHDKVEGYGGAELKVALP